MDRYPGPSQDSSSNNKSPSADLTWPPLKDNADWYQDIVEHSNDLLCIHNLQGRLLAINPAPARALGYTVEELLQISMREIIVPEFRDAFDAYLKQIERIGQVDGLMAVLTRTGERRIWQFHNTLRTTGVAQPVVRGMAHDVTERIRAEQGLRESESRERTRAKELATVLDEVPVPVLIARDPQCRYVTANRAGREHLRLAPGANASRNAPLEERPKHRFFRDGVELPAEELPMQQAAARAAPVHGTLLTMVFEDGTEVETFGNAAPLFGEDGQVCGAVATALDLTELNRSQRALALSEARYRSLVRASAQIVWTAPPDGRQNGEEMPEWQEFTGQSTEEMAGNGWADAIHPDDRDRVFDAWSRAFTTSTPWEVENRLRRRDGVYRHMFVRVVPVFDASGSVKEWVGTHTDITEKREAEQELLQSNERFRVALKNSPIVVFNQDANLRYTWVNNASLAWKDQGWQGKTDEEILGVEAAASRTEIKRRVLESGIGTRVQLPVSYGGQTHYFDLTIEPLRDTDGRIIGITGASTDVSQLRRLTEELQQAKERLSEEKLYLEQAINTELGFGEIIGQSRALQQVKEQVGKVASSDATVLLLGETGTGKELVARAIHQMSTRQGSSFIKMNCAAIPSGLLESELFGHEKGAYTGAVAKKIGRIELADKGTLFLDEIGEIPLALQPKLLRVLQDQEFERLGGTQTLKVDFRLIAATNRDLMQSVLDKQFRSDLFYRLNVFPVRIPPLRERGTDIALLIEHFVHKHARRMNKTITSVPKKTVEVLKQWSWPGNVRELENFIERSVILTQGSVLAAPIHEFTPIPGADNGDTLESAEREHIIRALRESRGQLSGPRGAAARLGLPRSTLQSKLKQLGIDHLSFRL